MAVNRDLLREEMEKASQRMGRVRYIKKGITRLRVLEFEDSEGNQKFSRLVVDHRKADGGIKSIGVCRASTLDKPCVFCRINELAETKGRERVYMARSKYYVNAIAVDQDAKSIRVWSLPTTVWEEICNYVLSEEWEDVLEPKTGHCFEIERTGDGLDTEYTTTISRKPYPVNKGLLEQVVDPLTEVVDQTLEIQARNVGVDLSELWDEQELEEVQDSADDEPSRKTKVESLQEARELRHNKKEKEERKEEDKSSQKEEDISDKDFLDKLIYGE